MNDPQLRRVYQQIDLLSGMLADADSEESTRLHHLLAELHAQAAHLEAAVEEPARRLEDWQPPRPGSVLPPGGTPTGGFTAGAPPSQGWGNPARPVSTQSWGPPASPTAAGPGEALGRALSTESITDYRGRSTRAEFWWVWLFGLLTYLGFLVVSTVLSQLFLNLRIAVAVAYLSLIVGISVITLPVAVRRMHDSRQSGWWLLLPVVNLVLALTPSDPEPNRYGPPRKGLRQ